MQKFYYTFLLPKVVTFDSKVQQYLLISDTTVLLAVKMGDKIFA